MVEVDTRPPPVVNRVDRARIELAAQLIAEQLAERLAPQPVYEGAPQEHPDDPLTPNQTLIAVPNGTAASDAQYVVAGGHALWPLSIICTLTTSATPADRTVALEYRTGDGLRYLVAGTQAVVTAGLTQSFCWHPQAGEVAWPIEDTAIAPLPQQHLHPGRIVALKIGNGQVGDVLSGVLISARLDPLV